MRRLLSIALLAAGCGHEPAPRPAPALPVRAVSVARAELRTRPTLEEVVGTVRARDQATIAPTLGGTVAEVRVVVGRRVRAGEVLVRLSARDIDARLEQARAVHALARLESDRAAALRRGLRGPVAHGVPVPAHPGRRGAAADPRRRAPRAARRLAHPLNPFGGRRLYRAWRQSR